MEIRLKSLDIENFKGIRNQSIVFGDRTRISGANATGKTTVFDAFTWLLFNKDSTGAEKFSIRPEDVDGNRIDNVEIKVTAVLETDGREVVLSKKQTQNWVKKRGTGTVKLQGNINSFEIDGYPQSETDYEARVSGMVSGSLFQILTNPQYFLSMDWKAQRDILMRLAQDVSDEEVVQSLPELSDLLPELGKAVSVEDIRKKFSKALSEWKKKQQELPVRIDELSRSVADIDTAELELAKNDLQRRLAETENKISNAGSAVSDFRTEEMQLQFDISGIKQEMNAELQKMRRKNEDVIDRIDKTLGGIRESVREAEANISENDRAISSEEEKKPEINRRYIKNQVRAFNEAPYAFDESKWVFDENSTVCSLCGQRLPEDRIAALRTDFEVRKSKEMEACACKCQKAHEAFLLEKEQLREAILAEADSVKKRIAGLVEKNENQRKQIDSLQGQEKELMKSRERIVTELESIPETADYMSNPEYVRLKARHEEVLAVIEGMKSGTDATAAFMAEKNDLQLQMDAVKAQLAKAARNVEIEERIGELKDEQKKVSQKVADQEKMLHLLDRFVQAKMNMVSGRINSNFRYVQFTLFEEQINGGIKPTCRIKYASGSRGDLNRAHRIIAGLDIISTLSRMYGVSAPVFLDNAESINDFNIPEMDCQMILLSVSEDKELKVEKGKNEED